MPEDHRIQSEPSTSRRSPRLNDVPCQLVDARREDARFLGWVIQTAFRSHLERGMPDIFVDGSEEECVQFLEALSLTQARHWGNYENFIIAEADGQQLGALEGYFVKDCDGPAFGKGAVEVARQLGWPNERLAAAWRRIISNTYVSIDRVPGAWVVESVAVRPAFRRMGLVSQMLEAILDRGRQRGATYAEISVFIGNDPAQRAYEKAGFAVVGEDRNSEFEAAFKSPGVRLLRRSL